MTDLLPSPHIDVRTVSQPDEITAARALMAQYGDSLSVDLGFQDFEQELANLPGEYASPNGALLVAFVDGVAAGCCAFRPLPDVDYANACEMKRLFVTKAFRGFGLGEQLIAQCMVEARAAGYMHILLDVLEEFETARHLYANAGFIEVPPYYYSPIAGSQYLMAQL
ncbi:GNAT family N-acetyltransferase [Comamonadaceae bacterium M7527]|nr:GNAT family N-acetyltransferase [Comamonadaceae bacterium M7527]